MNNELYAFYQNIDTQDRVSVVWRVTLTMPATVEGYVDVEATTHEEAAQLALDERWTDVRWHDDVCSVDEHGVEVFDVECRNPPVDAMLRCPGRKTGGNLDTMFGRDDEPKATQRLWN